MKRHLLLGFLIVVTPLLGQQAAPPNNSGATPEHPSRIGQSPEKPQHPRKDVATIAKETKGAVVSIVMADKSGQPIAQGSGFVVTRNGLVVTNYHVIKTGTSAVVKLPDGSFFTVDGVLAFDKERDVAIIKAHGSNFKTVDLGNSDRLQVGEEVVAIGSPLSLESTVSNGIVSGIRSDGEDAFGPVNPLLQITAPISHGSSGGPLFNMFGQVIGITSAALTGGENLNFAIPINDVKPKLMAVSKVMPFPDEAEEKATASSDQQPDLKSTVSFMRKIVEPDGESIDFVGAPGSCNIAYSGSTRVAIFMDGKKLDKDGNEVPTYSILKEWPYRKVSLGAIDPSKILSGSGFSSEYFEKTAGVGKGDLTIVNFQDADGSFKNFGFLIFSSQDRAEQFVTALKYAVESCGGQKSTSTVATNVLQANGESLCRQAASAAAELFSKLPFLHDGATQWDYDYHYVPTGNANAKCFIWFRSAHRELFTAPGAIPKYGLRFEDSGNSLEINYGSVGEVVHKGPEILRFESVVLDKGTDTELSKVFYCEVDDRSVHPNGSKTECQTWEELRNLVDYEFGIKYTGRLR